MLIIQIMDIFIFMLGSRDPRTVWFRAPFGANLCDIYRFLLVLVQCGANSNFCYLNFCGAVRFYTLVCRNLGMVVAQKNSEFLIFWTSLVIEN